MQLYYMARRELRAGMDAILIGTMAPADAHAVIDLYAEHLPTTRARQKCFELMCILDQVATSVRGEAEHQAREAARKMAAQKR